jgi:hypothetical protein
MAARRLGRDSLGVLFHAAAVTVPPVAMAAVCVLPAWTVPLREGWPPPTVAAAAWIAVELILFGQRRRADFSPIGPVRTNASGVAAGQKIEKTPGTAAEDAFRNDSLSAPGEEERDGVVQQSVRRRDGRGTEMISGTVRGDLPAGAERISLHVIFCPALARTPRVEAEPIGGPWSEIEAIHPYPHGIRFDIKLAAPTQDEAAVTVQYYAYSEPE